MHILAVLLHNVEKLFTLLQVIDSAVHVQDAQGVEGQEPGGLQAGSTTLIFSFSFYPFQIPFEPAWNFSMSLDYYLFTAL